MVFPHRTFGSYGPTTRTTSGNSEGKGATPSRFTSALPLMRIFAKEKIRPRQEVHGTRWSMERQRVYDGKFPEKLRKTTLADGQEHRNRPQQRRDGCAYRRGMRYRPKDRRRRKPVCMPRGAGTQQITVQELFAYAALSKKILPRRKRQSQYLFRNVHL